MPAWLPWERPLHWAFFIAGFLLISLWETYRPFRPLVASNAKRWAGHITLAALGHLATALTPISSTMVAFAAQQLPFALLPHSGLPLLVQGLASIVLLDLVRWGQHVCFHRVGFLWRMHRVHHADPDYDLTTTLRFHPFEVGLTQGSYLLAVAVLGPPPVVALGVELALLLQNFFGHANTALPGWLETRLRRVLVTPDMHRIHHSVERSEQNHNYGTMFPWWDRLFGTYLEDPASGQEQMRVGLKGYHDKRCLHVIEMLVLPFRGMRETEPKPTEPPKARAAAG